MLHIISILIKPFSDPSCPVDEGIEGVCQKRAPLSGQECVDRNAPHLKHLHMFLHSSGPLFVSCVYNLI